jgi:hypothetical protein
VRLPRTILRIFLSLAMIAIVTIAISSAGSQGSTASAQGAPFTVAPLSDGRQQAFRSVEGAEWIQSRWELSIGGPWTAWVDAGYPPTTAGVSALYSGISNNITYYYVYTDNGGNWARSKLSTDPNGGWTPYRPM